MEEKSLKSKDTGISSHCSLFVKYCCTVSDLHRAKKKKKACRYLLHSSEVKHKLWLSSSHLNTSPPPPSFFAPARYTLFLYSIFYPQPSIHLIGFWFIPCEPLLNCFVLLQFQLCGKGGIFGSFLFAPRCVFCDC